MSHARIAVADHSLAAVITGRWPLHYDAGADPLLDRPAHVRAGSSLARVPGGIALIQDDANFIALVDPDQRRVRAIALPSGENGVRQFDDSRGNKAHKLDLEACVAVEREGQTILLAFGSGSTARREQVAIVRGWEETSGHEVRVVHLPQLYEELRRTRAFAGSELNVEGAVVMGDRLRLFGRGIGADRGDEIPVNATCDLDLHALFAHLGAPERSQAPAPSTIVRYALGQLDGVALGFSDAAVWDDGLIYSAAAEDSPDAVQDGRVAGSAIGVIDSAGRTRWAPLTVESGQLFTGKVEGVLPSIDGENRLIVVVDADDPDDPSALCTVELRGSWHA